MTPTATLQVTQRSAMHTTLRELDHRNADGIDVRLLWDPHTNGVSIAVQDQRLGDSLTFTVDGAQALAAFHHPYAYANTGEAHSDSHARPNPRRTP